MNNIKKEDLNICKLQASLFEKSINLECSSAIFIRRFMNSAVAQQFDSGSIMQSGLGSATLFQLIEEEYGPSKYGKEKYSKEELYWMGYLYRYWQCTYNMPSKDIYKIIGAAELRSLYYAYHTLSPAKAISLIMEEKGCYVLNLEERQLMVMRELIDREYASEC